MVEIETNVGVALVAAIALSTAVDLAVSDLSLWGLFVGIPLGDVLTVVWNGLCVAVLLAYLGYRRWGVSG